MQSHSDSRDDRETSRVRIPDVEGGWDSTRNETGDPPLEQRPHDQPITSGVRDFPSFCYVMRHYDPAHWPQAQSKLKPIAKREGGLKAFVEAIHYFINAELFQTKHRRELNRQIDIMLQDFFDNSSQRDLYIDKVVPGIAELILETKDLFPDQKSLPILRQHTNQRIVLSKKQCACLLAHMVMCITCDQDNEKLAKLFNFSILFGQISITKVRRRIQKIKCIFTYFEEFVQGDKEGEVIFERSFLEGDHTKREWEKCDETLTRAEILAEGSIEDAENALQVVFSDKELGDQVLQLPTTQQQIMSLIYPELILCILFCEELKIDETVRVHGARRYSNYKGYGDSFEFNGGYKDSVKNREHVIMDAERYQSKQAASQFNEKCILRELNKAYAGFQTENLTEGDRKKISTGKWGCGVFKGNPQLKFMIQWLAASRAGREIVFYTFGDYKNFDIGDVQKILGHYEGKEVGDLFKDLERATHEMQTGKFDEEYKEIEDENQNLFKILITQLGL